MPIESLPTISVTLSLTCDRHKTSKTDLFVLSVDTGRFCKFRLDLLYCFLKRISGDTDILSTVGSLTGRASRWTTIV